MSSRVHSGAKPRPMKPAPISPATCLTSSRCCCSPRPRLVQRLERRARQLELAAGLERDAGAVALQRNRVVAFGDRLPAEARHALQHGADAVRPVIGQGLQRRSCGSRTSRARCPCAKRRGACCRQRSTRSAAADSRSARRRPTVVRTYDPLLPGSPAAWSGCERRGRMSNSHASTRLVHDVQLPLSHTDGGERKRRRNGQTMGPRCAVIGGQTRCRPLPVADQRLPACKRCKRCGIGAQDARAQPNCHHILYATQRGKLGRVEPALGTDDDRPWCRAGRVIEAGQRLGDRRTAAGLVAHQQPTACGPVGQQPPECPRARAPRGRSAARSARPLRRHWRAAARR